MSRKPTLLLSIAAAALIATATFLPTYSANAATTNAPSEGDPTVAAKQNDNHGRTREVFTENSAIEMTIPNESSDATGARASIPGNPYGCWAHTENVHGSHSFASVHANIYNCKKAASKLTVGAEIMKAGWFGQWNRVAFYSSEKRNSAWLDVDAKKVCSDSSMQTYRGNGYHRADIAGKAYVARTSSPAEERFACNAH